MLGGRFVPQMCYPISSGQLTQAFIFDEIAELPVKFCPVNLNNNHWVLLVFDFRSRFGWIWFADPLGNEDGTAKPFFEPFCPQPQGQSAI